MLYHLESPGALAVPARAAAGPAMKFHDALSETGDWSSDWREIAYVDLLDLADEQAPGRLCLPLSGQAAEAALVPRSTTAVS
jgi:hypothetical protein